jgi:preprotein translocase subunit SecD
MDPEALGAVYRGRAQFRAPAAAVSGRANRSRGEAQRRQTIAERKRAELTAAQSDTRPTKEGDD